MLVAGVACEVKIAISVFVPIMTVYIEFRAPQPSEGIVPPRTKELVFHLKPFFFTTLATGLW
jgi:hypothetical protein